MRILIVEDDAQLRELIAEAFREHGMQVATAATIGEARERMVLGSFAVIVLDVMLPGGNGVDFCRQLRARGVVTPVLMLTAMETVQSRIAGLDAGADDYLTKPFALGELLARVRSLARRPLTLAPERCVIADLTIDFRTHRVWRAGAEIQLTGREFDLLELLTRHAGEVVDRTAITAHVWDDNHDPLSNALEVLVRRLRAKVDDGHTLKLIETLRGAGYRFQAP